MSDEGLFISEVLKGFTTGIMQGVQMRHDRADKDRDFKLKERGLDIEERKLEAKSDKPSKMSYDDYLALDPNMPKDMASYERYVRAVEGKSDFHSTLMALAPGIANLPADKQESALESLYQKAMILKGKEYRTPEQRGKAIELDTEKQTLEMENKKVELDKKKQELEEARKLSPHKVSKLQKEVDALEQGIKLDKAKTAKTWKEAKNVEAEGKKGQGELQIVGFGSEMINDKRLKATLSEGFVNATAMARDIEDILREADKFKVVGQPGFMGKVKGLMKTATPTKWDADKMAMANKVQQIIMSLRIDVTGGGNVSDEEQKLLRLIASNPSAFWNNVEASKAALRALSGGQVLKTAEKGMAAGVVLPEGFFTSRGVRTNSKDPKVKKNWQRIKNRYGSQILSNKEFIKAYPNTAWSQNVLKRLNQRGR